MSDNAALIEEANEFLDADFPFCDADGLEERLVRALEQAERDLTELGAAFRDYKIVHPEGTR